MSWADFSEREKYISLKRIASVLFIGLMAWPRRWRFKLRSAGEVKAFKCLASRKGIISLVKYKRSYSNLKKGSNPSRNSQKAVSLGKGTSFQPDPKRSRSGRPKREATQKCESTWKRVQFHGEPTPAWKWGLKAKLNSTSKAMFIPTHHQSSSKYFKIWTIPF